MNEDSTSTVKFGLDKRYGRHEVYQDIFVCTIVDINLVFVEGLDS